MSKSLVEAGQIITGVLRATKSALQAKPAHSQFSRNSKYNTSSSAHLSKNNNNMK